ncbi:MAG: hypothetical protein WA087_01030 [Candidatus Saccharimonadales bacterium]
MKNKPHKDIMKLISRFFRHANLILFVIVLGLGLVAYIIVLNSILQKATSDNNSSLNANSATFDQSIINKINLLKPSSDNSVHNLPSGRINPFSE